MNSIVMREPIFNFGEWQSLEERNINRIISTGCLYAMFVEERDHFSQGAKLHHSVMHLKQRVPQNACLFHKYKLVQKRKKGEFRFVFPRGSSCPDRGAGPPALKEQDPPTAVATRSRRNEEPHSASSSLGRKSEGGL